VRTLAQRHGAISVSTFYNEPGPGDVVGATHDVTGIITIDWLKNNAPLLEADIFLCGPKPFLRALVSGLSLAGVAANRVHYEFFGPADEFLAA
jgi:nitric oxide dioxygenase